MDKLRVTDLEIGKAYKASNGSLYKISETHYNDELELLVKANKESEWRKSSLSAIGLMRMKFEEVKKEIDWAKVPFGIKVIATDSKKAFKTGAGKRAIFVGYEPMLGGLPFIVANFEKDFVYSYGYCTIEPGQEIKEEWYK
ncbi:hypothetical protein QTH27_12605 [Clostridium perfringens]|uniref:hypothetical protein n=1 Tax=Clostridium sp. TaxID=1506 RepID=UPI002901DB83|nr:hypothetical protein [Clostridium sp.]MDM0478618.1 hypothetical protein [Clostridium perfringens]MDU2284091.1 hypothetical protein [Clostridium sp.]